MRMIKTVSSILLLIAVAIAATSNASAECAACSSGNQQEVLNNEWAAFMDGNSTSAAPTLSTTGGLVNPKVSRQNAASLNTKSSDPTTSEKTAETASETQKTVAEKVASSERSEGFAAVLVPLDQVESFGIILDISPNSTEYIPGSVNIPYTEFLKEGGALKSVSEMAQVLGDAGISKNDNVLIYGECQPCGGGPSAATYVYWMMKYLGHDKVKLLDGGIDDWVAAKEPTVAEPKELPKTTYNATVKSSLMATYEYVQSGVAQIVDARTAEEFNTGAIPGAVNIPYDSVLSGKMIKDETELAKLFASLNKDKPVVIYTNTGVKASMVWFVLERMGYDARIYSWQDWQASQPKLGFDLQEVKASPNPANTGDVVQITAIFEEEKQNADTGTAAPSKTGNETMLTVKGCATCGFGSPQGYADLSNTNGVVQIGSNGQTQKSSADSSFKVSAVIKSKAGAQVSSVIMKRITGDQFAGIWNANVAAGVYSVDIVAATGEVTKTFADALEIQVSSTSKYKNLGN
ncbi:MAG: sulfurtransferase [Methanothrix sp.]|nr:MAG: sulfurtransferase [Methanothrix sp.]